VFAECLYRALHYLSYNDTNAMQRCLGILENIVVALTVTELKHFFGGILDQFLEKIISMV
jgi:hypothetical protein